MKHKIKAHVFSEFSALFDALVKRLDQTGEKIVRSKFVFDDMNAFVSFRATVWTERAEEDAPQARHGYGTPEMAGTGVVNGG